MAYLCAKIKSIYIKKTIKSLINTIQIDHVIFPLTKFIIIIIIVFIVAIFIFIIVPFKN